MTESQYEFNRKKEIWQMEYRDLNMLSIAKSVLILGFDYKRKFFKIQKVLIWQWESTICRMLINLKTSLKPLTEMHIQSCFVFDVRSGNLHYLSRQDIKY